jgi:Na+(H+)/acetate symporter ActP
LAQGWETQQDLRAGSIAFFRKPSGSCRRASLFLIVLLYLAFALGIGIALKPRMKTSREFLQAGRSLPAWICELAFLGASVGAQEVVGMGAAGA